MFGLTLLAACAAGMAQESYLSAPGRAWMPIGAEHGGGVVRLAIPATDAAGARARVLLAKPAWMAPDDALPPVLESATVDANPVPPARPLLVVAEGHGPRLAVSVADESNPVDPESPRLTLGGRTHVPVSREAGGRSLTAAFDLSALPVGAHEGLLEAADLSPQANRLRLPVRVTVNGLRRDADGQTVTVARSGQEYILGGAGRGQGFLRFGGTGAAAYLTTQVGESFVYARNIVAVEELGGGAGARLKADVIGIDNQDFGQIAELEFDADTIPEFPGLLLTSRARNLVGDSEVYCFWGWLPGQGYVTAEGPQTWSMTYRNIGKVGWVYLPPTGTGPGIGVISALPFGESRFGTLLVYTDPTRIPTPQGQSVEMKLAFLLTDSPERVREAHDALLATGWPR